MHTIRLRGPWQYEVLSDASQPHATGLPSGRVNAPFDWRETHGAEFQGRIRYRRNFNCPTGLADETAVNLCVGNEKAETASFKVALNGTPLTGDDARFTIRSLLQPANNLEITVELPTDSDHLLENVHLEIEEIV